MFVRKIFRQISLIVSHKSLFLAQKNELFALGYF